MHGLQWQDQRGVEGTGFVGALRSLLTGQLPTLMPLPENIISDGLKTEVENNKKSNGSLVNFGQKCCY